MHRGPRVAAVIDALPSYRGAERVLAAALEMFPEAEIHTLIYERSRFLDTRIADHVVRTSFVQGLPGGRAHYRSLLPLLPMAVERLDLQGCDIVLSFSYAVAHGVRCGPGQLHISYTFAPLRYAWQDAEEYFQRGLVAPPARLMMRAFRNWDRGVANRVHHFAAISEWTAECIRRAYQREAEVIYPPVETERFRSECSRGEYFVAFSRLVRQKRLELIVEAFTRLGLPLLVIGEGPERKKLESLAGPNVQLLGARTSEEAATLVGKARALVHAAEEDFGLVMAEAQAAGRPVIAYRGGAAPEIIQDGKTGLLFEERTVESVTGAVRCFVERESSFDEADCVSNAQRFGKRRFQTAFCEMVEREWCAFEDNRRRVSGSQFSM